MKKLAALVVLALSMLLIPVTTFSDVDLSPVGRWSVDSDYSTMHDNYMFAKTDFFFFEDGSIYRVSITKKRKENRLEIGYDDGVWIGDKDQLSIRVGKDVFQANIDDAGFLYVSKDDITVRFFRIEEPDGDNA